MREPARAKLNAISERHTSPHTKTFFHNTSHIAERGTSHADFPHFPVRNNMTTQEVGGDFTAGEKMEPHAHPPPAAAVVSREPVLRDLHDANEFLKQVENIERFLKTAAQTHLQGKRLFTPEFPEYYSMELHLIDTSNAAKAAAKECQEINEKFNTLFRRADVEISAMQARQPSPNSAIMMEKMQNEKAKIHQEREKASKHAYERWKKAVEEIQMAGIDFHHIVVAHLKNKCERLVASLNLEQEVEKLIADALVVKATPPSPPLLVHAPRAGSFSNLGLVQPEAVGIVRERMTQDLRRSVPEEKKEEEEEKEETEEQVISEETLPITPVEQTSDVEENPPPVPTESSEKLLNQRIAAEKRPVTCSTVFAAKTKQEEHDEVLEFNKKYGAGKRPPSCKNEEEEEETPEEKRQRKEQKEWMRQRFAQIMTKILPRYHEMYVSLNGKQRQEISQQFVKINDLHQREDRHRRKKKMAKRKKKKERKSSDSESEDAASNSDLSESCPSSPDGGNGDAAAAAADNNSDESDYSGYEGVLLDRDFRSKGWEDKFLPPPRKKKPDLKWEQGDPNDKKMLQWPPPNMDLENSACVELYDGLLFGCLCRSCLRVLGPESPDCMCRDHRGLLRSQCYQLDGLFFTTVKKRNAWIKLARTERRTRTPIQKHRWTKWRSCEKTELGFGHPVLRKDPDYVNDRRVGSRAHLFLRFVMANHHLRGTYFCVMCGDFLRQNRAYNFCNTCKAWLPFQEIWPLVRKEVESMNDLNSKQKRRIAYKRNHKHKNKDLPKRFAPARWFSGDHYTKCEAQRPKKKAKVYVSPTFSSSDSDEADDEKPNTETSHAIINTTSAYQREPFDLDFSYQILPEPASPTFSSADDDDGGDTKSDTV